jgi:hypothetical protein
VAAITVRMSTLVEVHSAIYNYPGKGHDRLYLNEEAQCYAVLDGAGGAELSEAIVNNLPDAIARHSGYRQTSQAHFLAQVVSQLDGLPAALSRRSTGVFVCIQKQGHHLVASYLVLGDAWLYSYYHSTEVLQPIAHTPTAYISEGGHWFIDTAEFLGAARSTSQLLPLVRDLWLPQTTAWSLAGFTDGVQDDDGRGISSARLQQILANEPAAAVPGLILDCLTPFDDAGLFILRNQP